MLLPYHILVLYKYNGRHSIEYRTHADEREREKQPKRKLDIKTILIRKLVFITKNLGFHSMTVEGNGKIIL